MNEPSVPARKTSKAWIWIVVGAGAVFAFVVLGVIATIVLPNLLGRFEGAQLAKARVDVGGIERAIDRFAIENGKLPESLEMLVVPDENGATFLEGHTAVPRDPWRRPYQYAAADDGSGYRLWSWGRDGTAGGSGADADIERERP